MKNTKEYPNIIYKDDSINKNEKNLQLCNETLISSLQKIFNGLGFKGIDTIILGSCIGKLDYDMEVCYYEMDCIVNDKNKYKITIRHEDICEVTPTIIITKGRTSIGYTINTDIYHKVDEYNPIKKKWYKKRTNKNALYSRHYDNKDAYIVIEKDGKVMHLFVTTPRKNSQEPYILPNEEQLIKYMLDTGFSIPIDELYKQVSRISLGYCIEYNFDEYPQFSLKIMEYNSKINQYKVTDLINIQNGRLNSFIVTENEETIKLSKDGSWAYEFSDEKTVTTISYKQKNQTINYSISSKYTPNTPVYNNLINDNEIQSIIEKIEHTKKTVEKLLTRNITPLRLKKTL